MAVGAMPKEDGGVAGGAVGVAGPSATADTVGVAGPSTTADAVGVAEPAAAADAAGVAEPSVTAGVVGFAELSATAEVAGGAFAAGTSGCEVAVFVGSPDSTTVDLAGGMPVGKVTRYPCLGAGRLPYTLAACCALHGLCAQTCTRTISPSTMAHPVTPAARFVGREGSHNQRAVKVSPEVSRSTNASARRAKAAKSCAMPGCKRDPGRCRLKWTALHHRRI